MSKSEASPFFSPIQNVAFRERGGTLRNKVKSNNNMGVIIFSKGVRGAHTGEVFFGKNILVPML